MGFWDFFSTKNIKQDLNLDFEKSEIESRKIIFIGHVQGVGFRYTVYDIANRLGLVGYVRNLVDGSVETVIKGEKLKIDYLIKYMKLYRYARISKIEQKSIEEIEEFESFEIR